MNPDRNEAINKLEKKLNSRAHPFQYRDERAVLSNPEVVVGDEWEGGDKIEDLIQKTRDEQDHAHGRVVKRILIGSILFFLIALGVASLLFFRGSNMVSADNIDISISAPTSVAGGEELSLEILVKNKNNANLQNVAILIEYPEGARVAGDLTTELTRQREPIGSIPSRGEVRKTVNSVLFGEKDSIKNIKITLEYRIEGSSALFFKDKNYDIGIKSSPIIVTSRYPAEVNANQEFEIILDLTSNTSELLRDVLVEAEFPFGFTFTSSTPEPFAQNNVWKIGDLETGDRRLISIKGILLGQNNEERTFRFSAGIASETNDRVIGARLVTLTETMSINKPLVSLDVAISGGSGEDHVSRRGGRVPVTIVWANNLPTRILDARIEVRLSGESLDRNMVLPNSGGFYRSSDNTIFWDKNVSPLFADLEPGERGAVSVSFSILQSLSSLARNQSIDIDVSFTGNQILPNNVPQRIFVSTKKTVKLETEWGLSARLVRSIGPFENSGPIPPRAEQETTYTAMWTATNSLNDISNAKISASLPPYVEWNGLSSPSSESVVYDPVNRTVTWNAGTIRAGTGFGASPREVAFQVTFLPSLGQVGTDPLLIGDIKATGNDTFTNTQLELNRSSVNTRISSDPAFVEGSQSVVK